MNSRNPKACETCRKKKIKCDGQIPCSNCINRPVSCIYRAVTRTRRVEAQSPLSRSEAAGRHQGSNKATSVPNSSRNEEIYHSVSATQANSRSSPLQLYYGPSSQFAFLQQIHRSILSDETSTATSAGQVQDVSRGLDMFLQKGFFFGTGISGTSIGQDENSRVSEVVPLDIAMKFLDYYMESLYHISPLFHEPELRTLVASLYDTDLAQNPGPQLKAITLTVLAIGASCTEDIGLADMLYSRAKIEAVGFDETVNLHAVQLSILLGIYQANLERSNSAYLHFGTACRKAFAMGLHVDIPPSAVSSTATNRSQQQQRRIAMWCLYWLERQVLQVSNGHLSGNLADYPQLKNSWHSMVMGRKSAMKESDISSPLPTGDFLICTLARLATIMTKSTEIIYNQGLDSTWEVYQAAENVHSDLRQFAEEHKIGPASREDGDSRGSMELVYVNHLYYQTVLLTFRPFLIVRASQKEKYHRYNNHHRNATRPTLTGNEMWLNQACRYAVDAAQDQITFLCGRIENIQTIKKMRYYCFFIESSCHVLLYDILCQKSKFPLNVEFISAAMKYMSEMVSGEPASTSISSIKQMLSLVEQRIFGNNAVQSTHTSNENTSRDGTLPSLLRPNEQSTTEELNDYHHINFPATPTLAANNMIHMRDGSHDPQSEIAAMDFNFDIFTTNLYHYFPMESGTGQDDIC